MEKDSNHAFVICAYGRSRYLGACIRSLLAQTVRSRILMVTSTPNKHIRALSGRYEIPLYVHDREDGIAGDWNFGYQKAKEFADYVTIVHQDDVYVRHYTQTMLEQLEQDEHPLIAFSNYAELRNGRAVKSNALLLVKRLMLLPLLHRKNSSSVRTRRRILSIGNPVMCPTVLYCTRNLPDTLFKPGLISNLDWEAWEELSRMKGSFIYVPQILLLHRIHDESTTSMTIRTKIRKKEDMIMFRKFWPKWIVRLWIPIYTMGENSNEVSG